MLALVVCACQAPAGNAPGATGAAPPPPPKVLFTKVVKKDVPIFLETVASVDGYVNADIRARVRGYLSSQEYKEGGLVKANQRLFTIERTEYETAVSAAQASLARANAVAERNRVQLERDRGLFTTGAVSQQQIDNAAASSADSQAQVEGARAQLQQAQLNLSYTQVRSPIDGVAGFASVRVGNLVGQDGPTLLTTVSQVDPMRVSFPISERDYITYQSRFKELSKRDLTWAKQQFDKLEHGAEAEHGDPGVELVMADGSVYAHRGVVVTAGRQFDASTGTIQVQALIPNPDGLLRPGQYGRVRLRQQQQGRDVLAVPDKALILVQGTYSLGVLAEDNKVQLRRVEVGPSVGGQRVILKGIQEGDRIVVEGVQKISDGALVQAEAAPEATAANTTPPPQGAAPGGPPPAGKNVARN
ncbi:MAG: efflux RND transporter periplasmic adaptor subunit [Polyangiales bacterium]